jgi:cell division septation protein DedD
MNTRLHLTTLAAVFAFLTPATSVLHAQVLAPTGGIDVPDGTRKCIKPKERAPKPTDLLVPLTCVEPVVNVSATTGNQAESFVNVNPTNTDNLVATSNDPGTNSIFRAYSTDAGSTWTRGTIATGVACCDGQAAWDTFGNLFLVYINNSVDQINVILSTDGGVTFSAPVTAGTGSIDQPSIAVGNGSVWVDWNQSGNMVARGAPVTGLGVWGPFNAQQAIPSATGSFGGIAVGPGPDGGKVIVTYQSPTGGQGPATVFANVDADGLGAGGFGPRITVSTTNVGGFDFIPAQNERSIDAEAGLVWDATGGPFNDRIYLVYTDETVNENNDTDILMRTSTDDGATWTAPVRVNDDVTTNSQFLPYVALDPTTGTVAVGFHDCRNDNGVPGPGGTNMIPNDDAEYYGTFSTDGGATWATNERLSGGFSNATASGNGIDYGDYVGQSALAGKLYTAWADNANCDGTNPNGTLHAFDLYANPLMLTGGTPTPTPTATPTATTTPTPTATATATPTPTATPTATATPTPRPTPTPRARPTTRPRPTPLPRP